VVFVETAVFTREITALLPDESCRALQVALMLRPAAGALIRGSGGLRKMRWSEPGKGKRGGLRIIYYWDQPRDRIYLLFPYRKSRKDDLTREQLRTLRRLVEENLR